MIEAESWDSIDLESLAETACQAVLAHFGYDPEAFEIAILACDDARIAALNEGFRGKATPTNVLSWPEVEYPRAPGKDPAAPVAEPGPFATSLGDIAISFDTCAKEAKEAGKRFEDHVSHLIVHGCLHLLGYDHVLDADADRMEGLETSILAKMGLPDPY